MLGVSSVGVQCERAWWERVVVVPARYRASAIAADEVAHRGAHSSGQAGSAVGVACGGHILEMLEIRCGSRASTV